jgi:hypothetical protein
MKYCSESNRAYVHQINKANVKVSKGQLRVRSDDNNTLCLSKIENPNTSVCVENKALDSSFYIPTLQAHVTSPHSNFMLANMPGEIESGFITKRNFG